MPYFWKIGHLREIIKIKIFKEQIVCLSQLRELNKFNSFT